MAYLTLTKSKFIHLVALCEADEMMLLDLDEKLEGDVVFTNYDVAYSTAVEEGYIKFFTDNDYISLTVVWKKNIISSKDDVIQLITNLNKWYSIRKKCVTPKDTRVDILINKECVSGYLNDY